MHWRCAEILSFSAISKFQRISAHVLHNFRAFSAFLTKRCAETALTSRPGYDWKNRKRNLIYRAPVHCSGTIVWKKTGQKCCSNSVSNVFKVTHPGKNFGLIVLTHQKLSISWRELILFFIHFFQETIPNFYEIVHAKSLLRFALERSIILSANMALFRSRSVQHQVKWVVYQITPIILPSDIGCIWNPKQATIKWYAKQTKLF